MTKYEELSYRPCVGMMLLNRAGLVFIGRRTGGPEHVDAVHSWQMPQGGLDDGEEPYAAALRELREETGVHSVALLAEGRAGSDEEIREFMSGNICRCGAYPNIVAAIREAAGQ